MKQKRQQWILTTLRGTRLRIEAERVIEGLPPGLSDEETCLLVDIARAFGLDDAEQAAVAGWSAYQRLAGPVALRLEV